LRTVRLSLIACAAGVLLVPAAVAQELPKPGPEHERLKKAEGTWDATVNMGGQESKGTMTYKMDLGGLWLVSEFEGEFGGMKFKGRGLDTYDAAKKKYVGIWVDSFSTSPLMLEGTYDAGTKTRTMTGEGPGMEGAQTKYKTVLQEKDDGTMVFTISSVGKDAKDAPVMTITYRRKK